MGRSTWYISVADASSLAVTCSIAAVETPACQAMMTYENAFVLLLYFLFLFSKNAGKLSVCEERKEFRISFKTTENAMLILFKHVLLISY